MPEATELFSSPAPVDPPPVRRRAPRPAQEAAAEAEEADDNGDREGDGIEASASWGERHFAIAAEVGWNSLTGQGLHLAWRPLAHLAMDLGVGQGFHGLRLGGRVRVPLLAHRITPTVGLGLAYDLGVSGELRSAGGLRATVDPATGQTTSEETPEVVTTYSGLLSGFTLQAVGGISWVSPGGFFLLSSAGYAFALPRASSLDDLHLGGLLGSWFAGSGPILSLAIGYAF